MGWQEPAPDRLVGRGLGDFVILEKIGEGGFGAVYRAKQPLLAREAVIKVLHARHRKNEDVIQRFLREARLASRLDHPYAAHLYAFGAEPDGLLWIAMELVRGTPLDKLLAAQGPLPLERFVPLLERLCEVVASAHEQGVVHRDLKPSNVMVLSRAGRLLPKLLDLGIAKLVADVPPAPGESEDGSVPRGVGGVAAFAATLSGELLRRPRDDASGLGATLAGPSELEGATLVDPSPLGLSTERARATEPGLGHPVTPLSARTPAELVAGATAVVTRVGAVVGSPGYMAPEQWVNPAAVDARTDLYALGILTFEALTGRTPFGGPNLFAVAHAHAVDPVPPLGPGFPPATDAVLRKVLSKLPSERYATALEFTAAFRAAAGMAAERALLPQLDEQLRTLVVSEAPQPLAEAVAALETARNVHQARDAVGQLLRVLLRYLGVVALAARTRVGPGTSGDSDQVVEALRALRRGSLDDTAWLELTRELCRSFARRPDTHPLPEIVRFFFDPGGALAPEGARLDALRAALLEPSATGTEEQVRALLARLLPELGLLLLSLEFLWDYQLVVPRAGEAERWMGVRRLRRPTVDLLGAPLEEGHPALVDRDGCPVLSLWPLAQVGAPTPGAAEELFLLEGHGRNGARLVALPAGFERHDDAPWEWFRQHLFDAQEDPAAAAAEARSPYLGLSPFTPADAALFFGREREVEAFVNRLRLQPLVAVVGPSGAGKSSFVQAGVVPALPAGWRVISVRPGRAPLAALGARLLREGVGGPGLGEELSRHPEALGRRLRQAAGGDTLVLVIDQFEELFTLCGAPEERQLYAAALVEAARSAEEPVRVVLTLRDDFLIRAEQLPVLRDRLALGLQLLGTPAPEELLRIVVEPARRAGYGFDDRNLPAEMVREVAAQAGALPLLSFTAAKLWELRDRHFKQLPRKAYEAMGGVGGALAQHAEATLLQMPGEQQRLVREVFRHLVTGEGTRAVLSRSELEGVLGGGAWAGAVPEALIAARLLVTHEDETGDDRIEVVHEALLSAWPRLVEWRRQDAEGARLRDQLRAAARQWDERGRVRGLLWRGEALAEYKRWRARYSGTLPPTEAAFAGASLADEARGRRVRTLLGGAVFLGLVAGVVVLTALNRRIAVQRGLAAANARDARQQVAALYEERGRELLQTGDAGKALLYLNAARQAGRDEPPTRFLLGQALAPFLAELARIDHPGLVWGAEFSPDGTRVLTGGADGTAAVWDARTGALLSRLTGHAKDVYVAHFSPDGTRILTGSWDFTARLWDARTGALRATLVGHRERLRDARFDGSGTRVVTASRDGSARLWHGRSGALERILEAGRSLCAATFDPAGTRVLAGAEDGTLLLWDARTGAALRRWKGHASRVRSLEFSPDGQRLVTAGDDRAVRLWDAASGALLRELSGHTAEVWTARFDPTGARLVSASLDGSVRLWNAATGARLAQLPHTEKAKTAVFSPDGRTVASAGLDQAVRLWDSASGRVVGTFLGHFGEINSVAFSPDGTRLVSAGGTVRIWALDRAATRVAFDGRTPGIGFAALRDGFLVLFARGADALLWSSRGPTGRVVAQSRLAGVTDPVTELAPDGSRVVTARGPQAHVYEVATGRLVAELDRHAGDVIAIVFARDGRFATASGDGEVRIGDGQTGRRLLTLRSPAALQHLAFSPDGALLAIGSADARVRLWDSRTGALRRELAPGELPTRLAFSPSGRRLAMTSLDHVIRLWDLGSGRPVTLEGTFAPAEVAVFSPDEGIVVTAGAGPVRIWNPKNGRLVLVLPEPSNYQVAFSGDGMRLLIPAGEKLLLLRDLGSGPGDPAELEAYVRCHLPYRLEPQGLVAAAPEPCREPGAAPH